MGWSPHRKTGLTYHAPAGSVKGYTLVTPMGGDSAYLLDMAGRVVHRWRYTTIRPFYGRLLDNGNLLAMGTDIAVTPPVIAPGVVPPFEVNVRRIGGNGTHLVELNWEGDIVWQYTNQALHHDFVRLPNGHTLMPQFVELPDDLARRVRGGYRVREKLPPLLSDDFVEVDREGKEVRRISLWKLLDPARDPICPLDRRLEWTHTNSLAVAADGGILFSCRHTSRVGIVDPSGDRLLWKYGFPEISHQHHATFLPNGNVQIFDNGMHRPGIPRSAVVEVDPKDSKVAWQYVANPEVQFFSAHISGADRLAGGNVLICEGASGRVFEVTRAGEVVWEWVNPFTNRAPSGTALVTIFRAHRYGADHAALARRDLDPERYRALNQMHGLDA